MTTINLPCYIRATRWDIPADIDFEKDAEGEPYPVLADPDAVVQELMEAVAEAGDECELTEAKKAVAAGLNAWSGTDEAFEKADRRW